MKKAVYVLLSIAVVLLVLGYFTAHRDQGSDQDQIIALIERGRQSVETKSMSSAMSCISTKYDGEFGLDYDRLKLLIADAFRTEANYEVAIDTPAIKMDGPDKAQATAHVVVSASNSEAKQDLYSGNITLSLTRDRTRKYLIFHIREWRVSGVGGLNRIIDL